MKKDILFQHVMHTEHLHYWFILNTPMTHTHIELLQTSNDTIKNSNHRFLYSTPLNPVSSSAETQAHLSVY